MYLITFSFFVFLAVTIGCYYIVPQKFQWMILLAANLAFYLLAAKPYTIVYLLITIVTVWMAGIKIEANRENPRKAKRILTGALILTIGILAALKYTNFLLRNVNTITGLLFHKSFLTPVSWAASLGVSFYTLQAVGYLLDVYWENVNAQKSLPKLAVFLSFFPQMSSGPISRYSQLEDQLYAPHRFDYQKICMGLQRILIGLMKKLVIAENLGVYLSYIFDDTANYNGWFIWIGMTAYVIQLYTDFSGCMDIVLGTAECFGVVLPENFNRPFHSKSIQEFWQRWHITLGAWARDYIMYPILHSKMWGKMRKDLKKKYGKSASKNIPTFLAMLFLWLFMGLWHGGEWRYIVQNLWFWVVIMAGQLTAKQSKQWMEKLRINPEASWWQCFQSIRTTIIFTFGLFFFRSSSIRRSLHYIKAALSPRCLMPSNFHAQLQIFQQSIAGHEWQKALIAIGIGLVLLLILTLFEKKECSFREWLSQRNLVIRWLILYVLLFVVILMGAYGPSFNASEFIYGGF